MTLEELIKVSYDYNESELEKNKAEIGVLDDLALEHAVLLAKKYNANETIIRIAMNFMDSKLPEASKEGVPKEHIGRALDVTKEYLEKLVDASDEDKQNIINCVAEHHGADTYSSIEAEICANADCYKFLSARGIMAYASILARRHNDLEDEWTKLESKMDEKYNILSMTEVREELEPIYLMFKDILAAAREV